MVFRFEFDDALWGEFKNQKSLHKALVKRGFVQLTPDSKVYYLRKNGVMIGSGEIVCTKKFRNISKLPKS